MGQDLSSAHSSQLDDMRKLADFSPKQVEMIQYLHFFISSVFQQNFTGRDSSLSVMKINLSKETCLLKSSNSLKKKLIKYFSPSSFISNLLNQALQIVRC